MALTVTLLKRNVAGGRRYSYLTVTGDSSYPTGGEALSTADLITMTGRHDAVIGDILYFTSERDASGRQWALDRANSKLLAFDADSEIANTTDISAMAVRVCVESAQAN